MLGRGHLQHAMTQVKNMWPMIERVQDRFGFFP